LLQTVIQVQSSFSESTWLCFVMAQAGLLLLRKGASQDLVCLLFIVIAMLYTTLLGTNRKSRYMNYKVGAY
jgi:type III secretory pathway component EscT